MAKNLILWLIIAVVLISVFSNFGPRNARTQEMGFSQFVDEVEQGKVKSVVIDSRSQIIRGVKRDDQRFTTIFNPADPYLTGTLQNNKAR